MNNNNTNQYYSNLDYAKWVCALLVIVIHTTPLEGISEVAAFYLHDVLARVAVPLFFAISGFGFFGKLRYCDGKIARCKENRVRLFQYLRSIFLLYIVWSAVYFIYRLPEWYQSGWWGWTLVKDYLIGFLFRGSHYHLWYLLSLLYAVPILYILLSFMSRRRFAFLVLPLWLVECALTPYSWLGVEQVPSLVQVVSTIPVPVHAVFRTVPLLGMGMFAGCQRQTGRAGKYATPACVFGALWVVEASLLYFSPLRKSTMVVTSTLFFTYFLLRTLLQAPQSCRTDVGKVLRYGSIVVYCAHPLILDLCRRTFEAANYVYWLVGTIVMTVIGGIYGVLRSGYLSGVRHRKSGE